MFFQSQWDRLIDVLGEDPKKLWMIGISSIVIVYFWVLGGVFTLIDLTNKPETLKKYKTQPGMNQPVNKTRLKMAISQVLFNQIIVTMPLSYVLYDLIEWRGIPPIRQLPTFQWIIFELICIVLVEEIGFYYSHRLFHHRLLYKHIHKKHHEWTAPIAITAMYCHPLEHIVCNMTPIFLGVYVMGSHMLITWLWLIIAISGTLSDHSGYHLPFLLSPEFHDFHHLKFTQCFGLLGLLDRFHRTDSMFRNSQQFKRHRIMTGLKSARQIYPDQKK